jgi:hypothetical protein
MKGGNRVRITEGDVTKQKQRERERFEDGGKRHKPRNVGNL